MFTLILLLPIATRPILESQGTVVAIVTNDLRGHGIVVGRNSVLTAWHVVCEAKWITVHNRPASINRRHAMQDLAWLSVDTRGWAIARVGLMSDKRLGRVGFDKPVTYRGRDYTGRMEICNHLGRWWALLAIDAVVGKGDSGRPVYQNGYVVGIVVACKGRRCFVETFRKEEE